MGTTAAFTQALSPFFVSSAPSNAPRPIGPANGSEALHHSFDEVADYALARRMARKFKKHAVFAHHDVDDIAQEFALHLWASGHLCDPGKWNSWESFALSVLQQEGCRLIRVLKGVNETGRRENTISLDTEVGFDNDGVIETLGDMIADPTPEVANATALKMDFDVVMDSLSDEHREVARRLLSGEEHQAIACDLSVTDVQFHRNFVKPIRRSFQCV
jgi:DNA-directed RNA polymerase specialized sigma24 family protein